MRTQGGITEDFPIIIGLHPRALRCMFSVDDIVLLGESRAKLNGRLKDWRQTLEMYCFCLGRSNTEYMECNYSKSQSISNLEVKVGDHVTLS